MKYTLGELAEHIGAEVVGDKKCIIHGVGTLSGAVSGQISFLINSRYRNQLCKTAASAVIVREDDVDICPGNAIVTNDPRVGYAKIANLLCPPKAHPSGIDAAAVIHQDSKVNPAAWIAPNVTIEAGVTISAGVSVGPGSFIGEGTFIGDNSRLIANVTVCHGCVIGQNVLIHPGVVIGSDGFGQANNNGVWLKVPQLGGVRIGDHVEIGANTAIDRGAVEDTVIEEGVKLDNLIQIAHNVRIGAHTVIAASTAIAGSTQIGQHCAIGGCVGIVGHLEITDNVTITGMSMVTKSIKKLGVYSSGTPLEANAQWRRNYVRFKQLDEMSRHLKLLEKRIGLLEQKG